MLVVKVELHDANTGQVSTIGEMKIVNVGTTHEGLAEYKVMLKESSRGTRDFVRYEWHWGQAVGYVRKHARKLPVWSLVAKAIQSVGFVHPVDEFDCRRCGGPMTGMEAEFGWLCARCKAEPW